MLYFLFGFLLAYFLLPLCESLEVLLQQKMEVKKAKYVKQVYDIRNSMDSEEDDDSLEMGFKAPPLTADETYEEEQDDE